MEQAQRTRRKRHLPADQRRKSIIEATMRCLADRGVDKTSIRDICAEAEISVGLISYYYDGKEALIADVYEEIANSLQSTLRQAVEQTEGSARQRLSAFIRASFLPVNLDTDLMQAWLSFWSMTKRTQRIAAVHDRTYGAYLRMLERLLADAAYENGDSQMTVRLAAIGLSALLDGLWVEWCLNPQTFTPDEGMRVCEACVEGLLANGVAARCDTQS